MSSIFTNSVWQFRFTLTDPATNTPYSLAGKTLEMHFKAVPGGPKLIGATTANGKLIVSGTSSNQLDVSLLETDTALLSAGVVRFDVLWTNYNGSKPLRLFGGRIPVKTGITISGG